jgi:hypothetical protein
MITNANATILLARNATAQIGDLQIESPMAFSHARHLDTHRDRD